MDPQAASFLRVDESGTGAPSYVKLLPALQTDSQRATQSTTRWQGGLESLTLTLPCSLWYKLSRGRKAVGRPGCESALHTGIKEPSQQGSLLSLKPFLSSQGPPEEDRSLWMVHQVWNDPSPHLSAQGTWASVPLRHNARPLNRLFFLPPKHPASSSPLGELLLNP